MARVDKDDLRRRLYGVGADDWEAEALLDENERLEAENEQLRELAWKVLTSFTHDDCEDHAIGRLHYLMDEAAPLFGFDRK